MSAVYDGNLDLLKKLINEGADVNALDRDGRTYLMDAISPLEGKPSVDIIKYLIDQGVDVNHKDKQYWTALHFAARGQDEEVVDILLEQGVEVDARDVFGNTPLSKVVFNKKPSFSIMKKLMQKGADPHNKNKSGVSPYDLAMTMGRKDIAQQFTGKEKAV